MAFAPEKQAEDGDGSGDDFEEQTAEEMTPRPRPPRQPEISKEDFYTFLNSYLAVSGDEINQWPKIQGRTLELWELWHAVRSLDQGRSPSIRNWELIAEQLDFDWLETPEVTLQLKKCYEATLGKFETMVKEFKAEDSGSEWELMSCQSVARSDTDREVADTALPSTPPPFHSSPPRILGQKRAFEPDQASSSADLGVSPAKRMRYAKNIEIPSSPEAAGGPQEKVAPIERDLPHDLLGFQSQPDLDSAADTSPSQQLHLENKELSPIPFAGFELRDVPYRSPLASRLNSNSNQRKVAPGSVTARPTNGDSIAPSIERPAPVQRADSPIEAKAKRRSLPASFHRAVSPPAAGLKGPSAAAARVSLPTTTAAKRTTLASLTRGFSNNTHGLSPETSTTRTRTRSRTTVSPAAPRVLPSGPTPPKDFSLPQTMEYYISLGYRRSHIIEAFKATLTWGLAAVVMQELKEGRGIPDNWEGVWTAQDDADLKFVLAVEAEMEGRRRGGRAPGREDRGRVKRAERLRRRLEGKHGVRRMRDREISLGT